MDEYTKLALEYDEFKIQLEEGGGREGRAYCRREMAKIRKQLAELREEK